MSTGAGGNAVVGNVTSGSQELSMVLTAELCLEIALVQSVDGEVLSGLWYVGVIMSIVSSIASNLGVNIQKYSMMKEAKKLAADPQYQEKPYIMQRTWLFGLVLVIAGSIGDFAALGFAAQTLATPVGGFTMVANVFFAHFFLKEHLNSRDIVATVLVVVGVVAVAASADKSDKNYTLECLLKLYQRTVFIVYVLGVLTVVGVLFLITRKLDKMRMENCKSEQYRKWRKLHPLCPAALSGVIGAQSVLFAKCSAELIKASFGGDSQFDKWETYVIVFCMLFTIFNQLHWLAVGLKHFDAVLIIPVFQCFFITGGVIGGGIMFDEFGGLEIWERALFGTGVITTVAGVILLSQREHPTESKVSPEGIPPPDGGPIIGKVQPEKADGSHASELSETERPPTPMPMSLQYHSLAMSDLYTALRGSLTTPEHGVRDRRGSFGGIPRVDKPDGSLENSSPVLRRACSAGGRSSVQSNIDVVGNKADSKPVERLTVEEVVETEDDCAGSPMKTKHAW